MLWHNKTREFSIAPLCMRRRKIFTHRGSVFNQYSIVLDAAWLRESKEKLLLWMLFVLIDEKLSEEKNQKNKYKNYQLNGILVLLTVSNSSDILTRGIRTDHKSCLWNFHSADNVRSERGYEASYQNRQRAQTSQTGFPRKDKHKFSRSVNRLWIKNKKVSESHVCWLSICCFRSAT